MRIRTEGLRSSAFRGFLALALALAPGCGAPRDPGERVWTRRCAACHGQDGRGRTRFAQNRPFADLGDGRWKQGGDRASIRRSIEAGVPRTQMEAFGGKLSPAQVEAVTDWVLGLAGRAAEPRTSKPRSPGRAPSS